MVFLVLSDMMNRFLGIVTLTSGNAYYCNICSLVGSVSFWGKLRSGQASDYQKLYHAAEIRSRSAATRCTWTTRRRASETFWLM